MASAARTLMGFLILLTVLSFLLSKFFIIGEILAEKFLKLFTSVLPEWIDTKWVLSSPFWLIYSAVCGIAFILIAIWALWLCLSVH